MAQALDAVALHEPHRAGIEVRPDGLRAVFLLSGDEFLRDEIERSFPACLLPRALAFRAGTDQRPGKPVRVVDALGVARDLGADDTGGVAVGLGPVNAADRALVEELDVERAGGRAVVRADGAGGADDEWLVHSGEVHAG